MIDLATNMKGVLRLVFAILPVVSLVYFLAGSIAGSVLLRKDKKYFMLLMQTIIGTLAVMMIFWMFYVIRLK